MWEIFFEKYELFPQEADFFVSKNSDIIFQLFKLFLPDKFVHETEFLIAKTEAKQGIPHVLAVLDHYRTAAVPAIHEKSAAETIL